MQKSKCTHIRVRDNNNYNLNIEGLIYAIERKLGINFKSLPEWEDLVKRLHVSQTDYRRRIQYANSQKTAIIDKLYMQANRPSPFELTDILARTAKKWILNKYKLKQKSDPCLIQSEEVEDIRHEIVDEASEFREDIDPLHPNTENPSFSVLGTNPISKVDVDFYSSRASVIQPIFIVTNSHKLLSDVDSKHSKLSCHMVPSYKEILGEVMKEWQPSTTAIICNPPTITITSSTLNQQSLQFSLTNCTMEYLHIRFKYVTDHAPFKKTKLLPVIPKRLYPGISVVFKFVFKLRENQSFKSGLYFRVGHDVYADAPTEPLFIPIITTFGLLSNFKVSETITIPPVYSWHIKIGPNSKYPTGILNISNGESSSYHMHIYEREINLADSELSLIPEIDYTECYEHNDETSIINANPADYMVAKSTMKNDISSKIDVTAPSNSDAAPQIPEETPEEMSLNILLDVVQLALNAIVFDSTYKFIRAHSNIRIPVYLTKAEHIGYHQKCYDFVLTDPETETIFMKKNLKVYAEVLPHPVQITPLLLDMSSSPVSHGYCEDSFIVTNTHKQYNVTIHIKLTTKMKKLFHVDPLKCTIIPGASVTFRVGLCCKEPCVGSSDLVHFTLKIITVGHKNVYENAPPIFYEMIIPCSTEFKKVYNENYFRETLVVK